MTRVVWGLFVFAFLLASSVAVSGTWKSKTKVSPIDDSKNVFLSLNADKKINTSWPRCRAFRPSLHVVCAEGELSAYVWTCSPADTEDASGTYTVLLRFDKEEAFETSTGPSTDRTALYFENAQEVLAKMITHKKMLFRFTPFRYSPQITYFDTRNFAKTFTKIRKSCGDDYTAIMEEVYKKECWDRCKEQYSYLEQENPQLHNWAEESCVESCVDIASDAKPIALVSKRKKIILKRAEARMKEYHAREAKEQEERRLELEREAEKERLEKERAAEEERHRAELEAEKKKKREETLKNQNLVDKNVSSFMECKKSCEENYGKFCVSNCAIRCSRKKEQRCYERCQTPCADHLKSSYPKCIKLCNDIF